MHRRSDFQTGQDKGTAVKLVTQSLLGSKLRELEVSLIKGEELASKFSREAFNSPFLGEKGTDTVWVNIIRFLVS